MLDFLLNNDFLSAILAFAIVLIPAIIFHELGHFLAAKAVGITVLEFGIGFPPRAAKLFTWGETEFTLNWLPIGGFVRPLGEDFIRPVSDEETIARDREIAVERKEISQAQQVAKSKRRYDEATQFYREELEARGIDPTKTKSVSEVKPLPRMFFVAAGAFANFLTAFIIFMIIGLAGNPEFGGARAEILAVTPDSPLVDAGLAVGDQIEAINGQTYNLSGELFAALNEAQSEVTLTVLKAGQETPVDVVVGTPERTEIQGYIRIAEVSPDSPAAEAGLQTGDLITSINDTPVATTDQLIAIVRENLGIEVRLTYLRAGESRSAALTPRNPVPADGAIGVLIQNAVQDNGFGVLYTEGRPQEQVIYRTLPQAAQFGFETTATLIVRIIELPIELIRGTITTEEARPVGPVGISHVGGQIVQETVETGSPIRLLEFAAIISIALGATNLLPIPALDGGRILFIIIEIIRGRPVAPEFEGIVHLIGLVLLLSLGVLVIINDIINPIALP